MCLHSLNKSEGRCFDFKSYLAFPYSPCYPLIKIKCHHPKHKEQLLPYLAMQIQEFIIRCQCKLWKVKTLNHLCYKWRYLFWIPRCVCSPQWSIRYLQSTVPLHTSQTTMKKENSKLEMISKRAFLDKMFEFEWVSPPLRMKTHWVVAAFALLPAHDFFECHRLLESRTSLSHECCLPRCAWY